MSDSRYELQVSIRINDNVMPGTLFLNEHVKLEANDFIEIGSVLQRIHDVVEQLNKENNNG